VPLVLLAVLAFSTPAYAASFDCAKASQCAWKYRCSWGDAQDEQDTWLATRSACGSNVSCISAAYQTRIEQLNSAITAAMQGYCVKLGIC